MNKIRLIMIQQSKGKLHDNITQQSSIKSSISISQNRNTDFLDSYMYFISLNSLEYTFLTCYPFPSSRTAPGTVASHVITGSIISTLSCTMVTTTITVKAFCTSCRRRNFLNIFVKLFCYISKYGFKQFILKIASNIHIMMRCFFIFISYI